MDKGNWTYRKLGEVAESELGKTLDSKKNTGNLNPYLCAVNVQWDRFELDALKEMKFEECEKERYSIREGDLVVCEGGDIGRCAIWNKKETVLYQNALHRVRFNGEMLPRFCMFFLMNLKKSGELDAKYGKGVTIKHLVKSSLLSIPVPVPPLPIQQRIVAELDCISTILEKKCQQLKELDNLAQAIFYDMFGDPVENEKGWEVKEFGDLIKLRSGQSLSAKNIVEGEFPVYGGNGIVGYHKEFNLEGNNIVIGRVGALCGNVRNVQGKIFVTDNAFILSKEEPIENVFLTSLLVLLNLRQYARDAMQPVISNSTLRNIKVILPPLSLQQSFAAKIEAIEKQKERISQSIKEVQTLFDSRMEEYFG